MKKVVTLALVLLIVLSMSCPAFAIFGRTV